MKLNSRVLWGLIIVFTIANLVDIITAMFILPGESNPLYLWTKSLAVLWAVKIGFILFVGWVYFKNDYPSRFWLYSFIYILVLGTLLVSFGAYSNIIGLTNPAVVKAAAQLSSAQKISYYTYLIIFLMAIPYIISMIAFKIYDVAEAKTNYKKQQDTELWDLISQGKK